MIAFQM